MSVELASEPHGGSPCAASRAADLVLAGLAAGTACALVLLLVSLLPSGPRRPRGLTGKPLERTESSRLADFRSCAVPPLDLRLLPRERREVRRKQQSPGPSRSAEQRPKQPALPSITECCCSARDSRRQVDPVLRCEADFADIGSPPTEEPLSLLPDLVRETQVSGPGMKPDRLWPEATRAKIQVMRSLAEETDAKEFRQHAALGAYRDVDLLRFLLARDGETSKAVALLRLALAWRSLRMPYWVLVDPHSDVAQAFNREARQGRIRATGTRDVFGRGVLLLDGSVAGSPDREETMRYLAYSIQATLADCADGVDKICVVLDLAGCSAWNAPSMDITREVVDILATVFPETLGTCICWQAPRYWRYMFSLVKRMHLMDPKTVAKVVFVSGVAKPGSSISTGMAEIFGPGWQRSLGLGIAYDHATHWPQVLARDARRAARACSPPWQTLHWSDVISDEKWDGAYPGFWAANLQGSHPGRAEDDDEDSECPSTGRTVDPPWPH